MPISVNAPSPLSFNCPTNSIYPKVKGKKPNQPRQTQTLLLKKDGLRLDLAGRFVTIHLNAQSLLGVGDADHDVSSLIGALVRIVYFISSYLTIM